MNLLLISGGIIIACAIFVKLVFWLFSEEDWELKYKNRTITNFCDGRWLLK